ncbi:hypothetical protein ACFQE5_22250 [Pseudonocardia hispaniensis]|uniref:Uncharacterized protein n=1 Tax=Pseudonocardia hispaniensis TaxID=904933 RepID=A0ABW1J942_9PSEU
MDTPHRPDWACLLHRPPADGASWAPADRGYRTCSPCLDRLRHRLGDIVARYTRLDPTPGATGDSGRRGPGFHSRSPANDHVIAMRDPRSIAVARTWLGSDGRLHREHEHPPLSVRGVLDTIAWDIAAHRGITGPPDRADVPDLARWIDHQLDWITRQPLVTEVDAELRQLQAQLKPVTGDGRRRIGRCPNTIDDGEHSRLCDTPLYAPTRGDTIHCGACGREWPRTEWLRLGDLLDAS